MEMDDVRRPAAAEATQLVHCPGLCSHASSRPGQCDEIDVGADLLAEPRGRLRALAIRDRDTMTFARGPLGHGSDHFHSPRGEALRNLENSHLAGTAAAGCGRW